MGFGGIWQWVIVLAIILLLFGTKKLRNLGSDLGHAVKGFRKGMQSPVDAEADKAEPAKMEGDINTTAESVTSPDEKDSVNKTGK